AVVIFIVVLRLEYVPVYMQGVESSHMEDVSETMSWIKSAVDVQTLKGTSGQSVSTSMKLGSPGMSFFGVPGVSGTLSFLPNTFRTDVNASLMLVIEENGTYYGDASETWMNIGSSFYNINSISSFRINVSQITKSHVGDSVNTQLYDAYGNPAGSVLVYIYRDTPDYYINVRTTSPQGAILYDQPIVIYHQTNPADNYIIDLMDSSYRFDRTIRAAIKPLSTVITESGLSATCAISYVTYSPGGIGTEVGGGMNVTNYHSSFYSGDIKYVSGNNYYVGQSYDYSGGALLVNQTDGTAMLLPPPVSFSKSGNLTVVSMVASGLTGDASTISGTGQQTVKTTFLSDSIMRGRTTNLTLVFYTPYPSLWADYIREQLNAIGLNESSNEFGITQASSYVRLYLAGTVSGDYKDVYVYMQTANIKVEIGS
ncbi:MAG: hypothetical protein PHH26_04440, partial [Candidatus Thermoplasmatota archaeon]|nr:hypothetical protein [Candidatus Thermoplasmatota archaeon]